MIVANMFVPNKFVFCSGLAYPCRMARDDESRKARLAAAAEARAAQAEMRHTVQAAMREFDRSLNELARLLGED